MCELLHTSNHRYFDGNNKGPLLRHALTSRCGPVGSAAGHRLAATYRRENSATAVARRCGFRECAPHASVDAMAQVTAVLAGQADAKAAALRLPCPAAG